MRLSVLVVLVAAIAFAGCLHGRGEHEIPLLRDYATLDKAKVCEADRIVKEAHRVGAGHFAPYEFHSARHYLDWAYMEGGDADRRGKWDYTALSQKYGEEAIAKGSGIQDKGELPMLDNLEQAKAEFERLKARYRELNPCKAKLVAPVAYAHIEANLSHAEHELNERCHYVHAVRFMRWVEPDIDAIWAKDVDGDGVKDMQDGDPWIPEDLDGFQDEDGIPEPKPYPVLPPVLFENDSAELCDYAAGYLRGIGKMLLNGYKEVTIHLAGHTDSDASDEYNLDLSNRRVEAVKAALAANGATQAMLKAKHHGEAKPVADNATEEGQAQNRRVEIKLNSPNPVSPYCN